MIELLFMAALAAMLAIAIVIILCEGSSITEEEFKAWAKSEEMEWDIPSWEYSPEKMEYEAKQISQPEDGDR